MGLARLVVAVATLAVLLFASWVLGFDVTAGPFVAMSGFSGVVSWLITKGRWPGAGGDDLDRGDGEIGPRAEEGLSKP